jgi:hypothetical protein
VRNGEVTTASTYVFSQKFDDLELTDVSSSNPLVTAEFEPANQLFLDSMSATSAVKVTISIQPGLPIGPFATSLTFKTNKEERPDFTINVVGHVLGAVLLSPEEHLDFGIVKVNEVQAKTIFVKIVGDSAVEVQKGKVNLYRSDASGKATGTPIDSSFLNVSLTKFEGRKNFWRLKVQIPQGSPGGKFKGVIELDTTHPTAKVVKIPVRFEISK